MNKFTKIPAVLMLAFFLLSAADTTALADIAPDDITNALPENLTHPYLFFTDEEKPAILSRIDNDPECHNIFAQLHAETNRLLYTPVEPVPSQPKDKGPQLFDRSGDFAKIYYAYRTAAYNLAFVYHISFT